MHVDKINVSQILLRKIPKCALLLCSHFVAFCGSRMSIYFFHRINAGISYAVIVVSCHFETHLQTCYIHLFLLTKNSAEFYAPGPGPIKLKCKLLLLPMKDTYMNISDKTLFDYYFFIYIIFIIF